MSTALSPPEGKRGGDYQCTPLSRWAKATPSVEAFSAPFGLVALGGRRVGEQPVGLVQGSWSTTFGAMAYATSPKLPRPVPTFLGRPDHGAGDPTSEASSVSIAGK